MTDEEFLEAFEECRIPKELWTHQAHVRMAWLYLSRWPLEEVIPIVREGINRYNRSLGNTEGYHETITLAFLTLIDQQVDREGEGATFAAFSERNPILFDRTLPALLEYYSRDVLYSAEARERFVEPDRAPLPGGKASREVDFEGTVG
jgi:hypothetical protein